MHKFLLCGIKAYLFIHQLTALIMRRHPLLFYHVDGHWSTVCWHYVQL